MGRILLYASFFILFSCSSAIAIDTSDWENKGFVFVFEEPTEDWLTEIGYQIMRDAYPKSKPEFFRKFIDKNNNSITVTPKKPYHDITKFVAFYKNTDIGYVFIVTYYIKPNVMTLTDVISRYGLDYGKVTTNEDLSKEITYKFTENDCNMGTDAQSEAHKLAYRCYNKLIIITFRSIDKVFVDAITFTFGPKDQKR